MVALPLAPDPERIKLRVLQSQNLHWNKYIPHNPTEYQRLFLAEDGDEALYGGAAGGGKSDALLMGALQYVDYSDYHAILFRRTYADLRRAGGLMARSHEWLDPWRESGEVGWNGERWLFPSGATIEFGYLDNWQDVYRYQGGDWAFFGFDELTQLEEVWYRYLFSRKRKLASMRDVPTRVRAGSNPGGIGHEWVYQRFFVEGALAGRVFVPARLEDNPYLDREDYERGLEALDPVTYRQLRWGDWLVKAPGEFFQRQWFDIVDAMPPRCKTIRMWDLAATKNQTSAYTAGALLGWQNGEMTVGDMRRVRGDPGEVEALIYQTAQIDGPGVVIWIEKEPGSGGINTLYRYQHAVLRGRSVRAYEPKHDKLTRAVPLAGLARQRGIHLLRGSWNGAYLDEFAAFPNSFKDQVDVCSAGLQVLSQQPELRATWLN